MSRRDDLVVERIRAAGVVVVGKTNVPEWAAGSHTFNRIFGTTRNPYALSRSAGGSSGGAAAALASGMVPLAEGSDMGGSLRNPASFCNVVGLRPSVGRVPTWPTTNAWELTSVGGPMARNVEDLALLLSVIAGPSTRAPMSLETPGSAFAPPLTGGLEGLRVAMSVDLGGVIAVDHGVARIVQAQEAVFSGAGAHVEQTHPDLAGAEEVFRTLRAWLFQHRFGTLLAKRPDAFKQSLADNIRAGADLTGADVARAYERRTRLAERVRTFFEAYDVLVMPVSQVPPFSADDEYPTAINGRPQATYLDWMRSAYLITVTGCPAISVPAGFTAGGVAGRHPDRRGPEPGAPAAGGRARLRAAHPVRRPPSPHQAGAVMTTSPAPGASGSGSTPGERSPTSSRWTSTRGRWPPPRRRPPRTTRRSAS